MKHFIVGTLLAFSSVCVKAQATNYYNTNGIAMNGYDAVAYFSENRPMKGMKEWSYNWNGVQWNFKNAANLEAFKASPLKYAPQFGGYCAYGVSENHKAATEPDAFTISGGKLYFNYNKSVQQLWLKDTTGYLRKAEGNWPGLTNQNR
jgi:YHS domain-containing protein